MLYFSVSHFGTFSDKKQSCYNEAQTSHCEINDRKKLISGAEEVRCAHDKKLIHPEMTHSVG